MKKNKILLTASGLLAAVALVGCANSRDVKPQYNIDFANCYSKDRTGATEETDESQRVFPDWAYPGQRRVKASSRSKTIVKGFGYVGSGDNANVGSYTISGNTEYQLGDELDLTMTLDDFVTLNPIDGELIEHTDPDSGNVTYEIKNPVYFKIYVSDKKTYNYNELKRDCYTVSFENNVVKFKIPGKYVKFSYKVYFSCSYLNVDGNIGFQGFNTIPYMLLDRESPTEFEKSVPSNIGIANSANSLNRLDDNSGCYEMTNTRVGSDLTCLITPTSINGGLSFDENYLKKLQFYGVKLGQSMSDIKLTDVTDYVHTNLIKHYSNVPNFYRGIYSDDVDLENRIFTSELNICRVTFPWVNAEHPEGGLFKFANNQYTLNYNFIGVTVKDEYVNDKIPFVVDSDAIKSMIKVNSDSNSIKSVESDYKLTSHPYELRGDNHTYLTLTVEPNENYYFDDYDNIPLSSIKIVSKVSPNGDKYFKDVSILDSKDMKEAVIPSKGFGYVTDDNFSYNFSSDVNIIPDEVEGSRKATIYIDFNGLLSDICYGSGSYDLSITSLTPLQPVTFGVVTPSVTLDMIESVEVGLIAYRLPE